MNFRQTIANRGIIIVVLFLQVIPLMLFPAESFTAKSQEWWLPAMLSIMALVATIQLIASGSDRTWPWDLIAFSHGFNVISRLMMIWPKATVTANGVTTINWIYILMTIVSITCSWLLLWYTEQPNVRIAMIRKEPAKKLA